jgi:hypothetical protein
MFVIYTREQLGENPKLAVLFRAGPSTPNCSYPHVRLRHSIIVREKPVHADLQSLSRPFLSSVPAGQKGHTTRDYFMSDRAIKTAWRESAAGLG